MTSEGDAGPPVVVGVDGSEGSVAALRWAVRYSAATGTPVRAVLAWHYPRRRRCRRSAMPRKRWPKKSRGKRRPSLGRRSPRRPRTRPALISPARPATGTQPRCWSRSPAAPACWWSAGGGTGGFLGTHLGSVSLHCVNTARCPVVVVHSHADGW